MPYQTIVAGTTITSSWANANVRDQAVTPFANAAARTSAITSPVEGMVSYLQDTNRLDFYDATVWRPIIGASAKVVKSSNQTVPAGSTTLTWATQVYDSHSMWSGGNPTRLTAPWTGYYGISTTANWTNINGGKERRVALLINGTVEDQQTDWSETAFATLTEEHRQNCSALGVYLTAGQFAEVQVRHDAGADRTISSTFSNFRMVYMGPAT